MPRTVQSILAVLGWLRLSALFLMAAVGNEISDFSAEAQVKQEQLVHFLKSLGLMGARLLVIANGTGPMSLDATEAHATRLLAQAGGVWSNGVCAQLSLAIDHLPPAPRA